MCAQPELQKASRKINFFQNQLVLVLRASGRVRALYQASSQRKGRMIKSFRWRDPQLIQPRVTLSLLSHQIFPSYFSTLFTNVTCHCSKKRMALSNQWRQCCSCTAPSHAVWYCWPGCQQQYRLQSCLPAGPGRWQCISIFSLTFNTLSSYS